MFYIYSITNIKNNKRYVGITQNIKVRTNRHFNKLRNNRHRNRHLQSAFDLYGEESFKVEVIEELECPFEEAYEREEYYIEYFDSFDNGYNGNRGGLCHNGTPGKFNKEEIFQILSAMEHYPRSGQAVGDIFGVTRGTVAAINRGERYVDYYAEYHVLSKENKQEIYDDFCEETNFIFLRKRSSSSKNRKLSKEQVFVYLIKREYPNVALTDATLAKEFKVSVPTLRMIGQGLSYKDCVELYKTMSHKEKQQVMYLYAETHSKKPFELLETP